MAYTRAIKDMQWSQDLSKHFPVVKGLHQGQLLLYHICLCDGCIIKGEMPRRMLFAYYVVLIEEIRDRVNPKLKV